MLVVAGSAPPPSVMFPPADVTVPRIRIPPPAEVVVSVSEFRTTFPPTEVMLPAAVIMMFSVDSTVTLADRDSTDELIVKSPSVAVRRMSSPAVPALPLETVPSKLTFPPPLWSNVMVLPTVVSEVTVTSIARTLSRSIASVDESALIDVPASSSAAVLPIPLTAFRSIVPEPTVMSIAVSAIASLMAPADVTVTVFASAVTDPTRTSPAVSVVALTSPVPPAVTLVSVSVSASASPVF